MRFTPVRCYVLLDLIEPGKLIITRNGAQEPNIFSFVSSEHPFTQRRLLTAVADLHAAGMIQCEGRGLHGVYKGKAEVAPVGLRRLHLARRAQQEFAEKAERDAAERKAFAERQAEQQAAFKEANQVLKSDEDGDPFEVQCVAAAERVRAQLDIYRRALGADLGVAAIMVRVSDDTVVSIDTADLLLLCDAVAGPR